MTTTLREDLDVLERYNAFPALPDEVLANLNPALPLRPYQRRALARLLYVWNCRDRPRPAQWLLHMATGSGKTLIMAAAILYLYTQGYRHFLFFVNSTNIIEKTRDNFLNPLSGKYLFAERLKFGPKEVRVREVSNFQAAHPDEISILFTTIQGLHTRLNTPRENALTYDDFAAQDVVLISDEAHHINALTKSQKEYSQEELFELTTWEATVRRIFQARAGNVLLEFTATVELDHPAVREKYADKIIFQYWLKEFREDGYSKEVKVLAADMEPMARALQAAVLSQYRRKVAEKQGLPLKPVLLMKSRTIKESQAHEAAFKAMMRDLDAARLEALQARATGVVRRAFDYFAAQGISRENLAAELRGDFDAARCLIVNSKEESEAKQLLVNSLEERGNEIRVVFTVNMLNEGWDVLNLFDIVRLYDTRDARQGVPGRTTISEAQLIGRGARYWPFQLHPAQPKDQRKYDEDVENELRMLEELYYHSAHNPRYIDELHRALVDTGIVAPRVKTVTVRVKEGFKASDFWQRGMIFVNRRVQNPRDNILGLGDIPLARRYRCALPTGVTVDQALLEGRPLPSGETITRSVALRDLGENVLRVALQRLDFFQFATLKRYLPLLRSIPEFIASDDYLGQVMVDVTGAQEQLDALSQEQKLRIAESVLQQLGKEIETGTPDYIGTRVFEPLAIRYCVRDKTLQIALQEGGDQERGVAGQVRRGLCQSAGGLQLGAGQPGQIAGALSRVVADVFAGAATVVFEGDPR